MCRYWNPKICHNQYYWLICLNEVQHFFFSGAFLLYLNFSCRERHGIFKNLDQEHCFAFHSYLHDSYMYIHAAHASMDCQILPYMHRPRDPLNLAYLHPQVHGSSSPQPWIHTLTTNSGVYFSIIPLKFWLICLRPLKVAIHWPHSHYHQFTR